MVVHIWRITKVADGTWPRMDTVVSQVVLPKFAHTRKGNQQTYPIPGEMHLSIPMGVHPREFNLEFVWNEYDQATLDPLATYGSVLKLWDCSPLYYVQLRYTSMYNDMWPEEQYCVCKSITTTREPPGVLQEVPGSSPVRRYGRWQVKMDMITAPTPSMEICPAFEIPSQYGAPSLRTDGVIGLYLANVAAPTIEYIDAPLTKIEITYNASIPEFPILNEVPLMILPPLGSIGPVANVTFRTRTDIQYARIKRWITGYLGDTVVKVVGTSYEEFDDDQGDGVDDKNSKWIVSNITVNRAPASGGAYTPPLVDTLDGDLQINERLITMTLTRYWKWELMQ